MYSDQPPITWPSPAPTRSPITGIPPSNAANKRPVRIRWAPVSPVIPSAAAIANVSSERGRTSAMVRATPALPKELFQQLVGERPVYLWGSLDDLRGQEVDNTNPAGSVVGNGLRIVREDRLDRGTHRDRVTDLTLLRFGTDLSGHV